MSIELSIRNFKKCINNQINKINDQIIKRNNKLTFKDILFFMLNVTGNNLSYDIINSKLKCDNICNVSKTALIKKKQNIPIDLLTNINESLINHIYDDNKIRYIAVDGTQINLHKKLKDSYDISKNKEYCSALVSSLIDVDTKIPINYSVFKSFNERAVLLDQLKYIRANDVLIMDRGYYSKYLANQLIDKNINFIFRLPKHLNIIKNLKTNSEKLIDYKTKNKEIKLKYVSYTVNQTKYYVVTTLVDKSIEFIKEHYWKRWTVETDFRHCKYDLSMLSIKSKSKLGVEQSIAIHNFILIVTSYIEYLLKDPINGNNYKINKKNTIHITIDKILGLLIYGNNSKKTINKIQKILSIIKSVVSLIKKGRSFKRCKRLPTAKWCIYGKIFIKK